IGGGDDFISNNKNDSDGMDDDEDDEDFINEHLAKSIFISLKQCEQMSEKT
ncbi:hypothetical protein ACJ72_08407, partial [Emergomyces africanus]